MKVIESSLFDITEGVVGYQADCWGKAGVGISAAMNVAYPSSFILYKDVCLRSAEDPKELLGTVFLAPVGRKNPDLSVLHIFGQLGRSGISKNTDYNALAKAAETIKEMQLSQKLSHNLYLPYGMGTTHSNSQSRIVMAIFDILEGYWCRLSCD